MQSTTDLVTKSSLATMFSHGTEYLSTFFLWDDEEMLEDFFQICKMPNDAELIMLCAVCEVDLEMVKRWCKSCMHLA